MFSREFSKNNFLLCATSVLAFSYGYWLFLKNAKLDSISLTIITAGCFIFLASVFSAKRRSPQRATQKDNNDLLLRAVQLLGHQSEHTRQGGLLILQKLAQDDVSYLFIVMDIISTYVRSRSPNNERENSTERLPVDVEVAMILLCDLSKKKKKDLLNYTINLSNLYLTNLNLQGINFSGANLSNSYFHRINFSQAIFDQALLNNASFEETNLTEASFMETKLQGANLSSVVGLKNYVLTEEQVMRDKIDGKITRLPRELKLKRKI